GGGVELRDYWRVIRQRWRVVVASTLLGLLGATGLTIMTPPTYQSTVELFVAPEVGGTSSELMQGSSFLLDRVKSYVAIADKAVVLEPVRADLGLNETVGELAERVSASVVPETVVVRISVEDDTAE